MKKRAPLQLWDFYVRRVLRIFPVYYVALAVFFLLLPMLHVTPSWLASPGLSQAWYWLYLNNWSSPFLSDVQALGHFWSLAVEEQFYLLWPVCVIFLRRRTLLATCLMLLVSAPLFRLLMTAVNPELAAGAAYRFTIARWDALAIGALIALVARDRQWLRTASEILPLAIYGSLAYLLVFTSLSRNFAAVGEGAWFNQTAAALLFAGLLFHSIQPLVEGTGWRRFLGNNGLRSIGKYSYAIYVVHLPILCALRPLWHEHVVLVKPFPIVDATVLSVVVFTVSYVVAFFSWRLLERPCLQLRRFLVRSRVAVVV